MPATTYKLIQSATIVNAITYVEFTSVPQTYTDLVLVVDGVSSGTNINYGLRFNSTATGYDRIYMAGDGSTAFGGRDLNLSYSIVSNLTSSGRSNTVINIMNYSNTSRFKTILSKCSNPNFTADFGGQWKNTAAIDNIVFLTTAAGEMQSGTKISLYGIKAQ